VRTCDRRLGRGRVSQAGPVARETRPALPRDAGRPGGSDCLPAEQGRAPTIDAVRRTCGPLRLRPSGSPWWTQSTWPTVPPPRQLGGR